MMNYNALLFFIFLSCNILSQKIEGYVYSKYETPIEGVLVSILDKTKVTNEKGYFSFQINFSNYKKVDFYAIGYKPKELVINNSMFEKVIHVVLFNDDDINSNQTLNEVLISSSRPISQEFAVKSIKKIDIYTTPESYGDPIRTINSYASSTAVDESAEISIRGTNNKNSIVFFNKVPLYEPIRDGGGNGTQTGVFSILNTDNLSKINYYSSNPPLTLGKSTSGLIEAYTTNELKYSQLKLSLFLSNIGIFYSKNLFKKKVLFETFANYSNSDSFLILNGNAVPSLNNFKQKDFCFNTKISVSKKSNLNIYFYLNDDIFRFKNNLFNYNHLAYSQSKRFLSISNYKASISKALTFDFNTMFDSQKSKFKFGNLDSNLDKLNFYTSANLKYEKEKFSLSTGINYENRKYKYFGKTTKIPFNYYPETSQIDFNNIPKNEIIQSNLFVKYKVSRSLYCSIGVRGNFDFKFNKNLFFNFQSTVRYKFNNENSLLFALGKYTNYGTPDSNNQQFYLFNSWQYSIDYQSVFSEKNLFNLSFFNTELSNSLNLQKNRIFGIEALLNTELTKNLYFKTSFSLFKNKVNDKEENREYSSSRDISPIIKGNLNFWYPKIKTQFSLLGSFRKGIYYTPIISKVEKFGFLEPILGKTNESRLGNYFRLDLLSYKQIKLNEKSNLLLFASINNILDVKNDSKAIYNKNYDKTINKLSGRLVYFGLQVNLK